MMVYCYEHDAWTHTDEYLEASLASSGCDRVHESDGAFSLKAAA